MVTYLYDSEFLSLRLHETFVLENVYLHSLAISKVHLSDGYCAPELDHQTHLKRYLGKVLIL